MYTIYNVIIIGAILLIVYMLIDFIRNKTSNILRRIIFYSFIFYIINLIQLTTGGIVFPPQTDSYSLPIQLVPLYFIWDLIVLHGNEGSNWFFWNSVKLSFYNLIMLMPLGIYLSLLFNIKRIGKVIVTGFSVSFIIELSQLVLGYFGFVMGRGFNIDDLILNTLGGVIGFLLCAFIRNIFQSCQNGRVPRRKKGYLS